MTIASYADEQTAILDWLDQHWAQTPVAKPNTHHDPGDRSAFVRVRIARQAAFNADIATARRVRHPGLLSLEVRVPTNLGDGLAIDYADQLADAFRNAQVGGAIHFRAPTVRDFGPEGGWHVVHVDCPYWRDTTFT